MPQMYTDRNFRISVYLISKLYIVTEELMHIHGFCRISSPQRGMHEPNLRFLLLLQTMSTKRVKTAAEKEKDRLRTQRYRDEHSADPEYRTKLAAQAKADRATKGPAKYSPTTKARKAANLIKWRQRQRGGKEDTERRGK